MTFQPNKPSDSESPSLAPAQIRTNWNRLQTIIQSDHIFNAVADSDDGWHNIVNHMNQVEDIGSGTPAVAAGRGKSYTKTITTKGNASSTAGAGEHLCYQRGTGGSALQEASLSVCPVRAAVSFAGRNSNGDATLFWSYNIDRVERTDEGDYTFWFEVDMPSIYYVPFMTAGRATSGNIIGQIKAGGHAGAFFADRFLGEYRRSQSETGRDPGVGTLIIFGG